MASLSPVSHQELVRRLRGIGFVGPFAGGRGSRRSLTSGGSAARLLSALAAFACTLAALSSAPAAAQTVIISATGNCGGTPANCGTPTNRNGDRDTTWPDLQVDEGDTVSFYLILSQNVDAGKLLAVH